MAHMAKEQYYLIILIPPKKASSIRIKLFFYNQISVIIHVKDRQ